MIPTLLEENAPEPDAVDQAITALSQRTIDAGTANEHSVPADFSRALYRVLASVATHPFREGNGRTSKIFMEHVAEQITFTLDFSQVDRDLWDATCETSRPKPEQPYLDPLPLVIVFALATKERGEKEPGTVHLGLSKASNSVPAAKSLNHGPQGQDTKARRGTAYLPGRSVGNHER